MNEKDIIDLYRSGFSLRGVGKYANLSGSTIWKILKRNSIPRRSRLEGLIKSKQNSFNINEYVVNVIEGELLGDGHLRKGKHQSCFSYGSSKREYVEWLANIFVKNNIPLCNCGVYVANTFDKRYNKFYKKYLFSTLHSTEFKNMRNLWYPNGIKVVPNELKLTPTHLLHWWIGDGHLNKKNGYGWLITDNFTQKDVIRLSDQLLEFKIKNYVRRCKNNNKWVYRIYIPRKTILNLLETMGNCPVKCYLYKWNVRRN